MDAILLFALVTPFVMTYRISPGETPYWLFGLIFLGIFVYLLLDLLKLGGKIYFGLKQLLLLLLIIIVIGSAFISAIVVRHKTHPVYMIHDMPLQQEIAIRFLLDKKNPYNTSYFGTFLEQWHYSDKEVNPALYHFVLPPFYILFAVPFYFLSNLLFGFFDARTPLLFLFFSFLLLAGRLVQDPSRKLLFIILLAFNPAMLPYTLEGRSDIFMFGFLFMGLFLLHKKRYFIAGIPIALAFAVKQSAWPILPFYVAFLYFTSKESTSEEPRSLPRHLRGVAKATSDVAKATPRRWLRFLVTAKYLLLFTIIFVVIVLPFFLWDPKAFLDSTVFYLSGNVSNGYPISGYGLSMLLHQMGTIKELHQYYPFHVWQAIIGIPLGSFLIAYLKKSPTVARLIVVYGIFLFVFWYLSRYFNNSHLGYLSLVFITAYFWPKTKTT